jgi:hypothetical protein
MPARDQTDQEENYENDKEDPGDLSRRTCEACKAQ